MWRCKLCGGTKFEMERKIINRDFDSKKNTFNININDVKSSIMCCRCYNQGEDIRDIATWEGKDERD